MAFLDPVGLPDGDLRWFNLSDIHEENACMEDIGWLQLPNGFDIDLGFYRESYCVKVYLNLENRDPDTGPVCPEIDLMAEFMEEERFVTTDPRIALTQFVDIANHFAKAKIKTRA